MRRFLAGVLVGILLSVGTGLTAFLLLGSWLAVEDPLEKVDAIVAISGDTGARADTAITLWKAGWAPIIVFSGAAIDPDSVSSAEIMRREALRQGVPENAVLVEGASTTTEESTASNPMESIRSISILQAARRNCTAVCHLSGEIASSGANSMCKTRRCAALRATADE